MRTRSRVSLFACSSLVFSLAAPLARAQTASDKAAAQALFDDGQKAANAGDWSTACPKYAESNRLDPGIGVKLYLGDCYEHLGKTASAWAMFAEAEEYAHKTNDPRASVAKQREDKLTPRLVTLTIDVSADARVDGLAVLRDGEDVGAGQWGTPLPIDPGPHTVMVSAPGRTTWSTQVDAREGAGPVSVTVPKLELTTGTPPRGAESSAAPTSPPSSASTQRTLAIVAAGAGVVGVVLGTVFGVDAKSKLDQSNDGHCHAGNECDAAGVSLRSDAMSAALGSTIAFAVGAVGLAGGAVLWFTAPKATTSVGVAPTVTDRFAGLSLRGAF